MSTVSRLEKMWEHDKNYTSRYMLVFSSSVFIHVVLALMFVTSGQMAFVWMNGVSVVLYLVWLFFFSRTGVSDALLLFPYVDVLVHACVYNLRFGVAPAFFLYMFTIIPVSFFLSSRDAKTKHSLEVTVVISVLGVLLMLGTLNGEPRTPFESKEICEQYFQVNMLMCSILLGIYTWEFLTEMRNTHTNLTHHAEYDQLTGLRNRYSLHREIKNIQGTQYCIIMCDIDDFKQINDNFGHSAGDEVLSRIGKVLKSSLRREDITCRWGGEEFLLVVKSDLETTRAAVERIRRKLNIAAIETGNTSVSVTMTFGLADCMEADSFEKVTEIADENLLRGKRSGKNCVIESNDVPQMDPSYKEPLELDTSNLAGAIFAAFSATSDSTYLYICNMSTGVSRWSKSAVDYFGLPGEYMYDAGNIWLGFVHPDDRALYAQDIDAVFSGRKRIHDVTYRARNKNGEYVTCVCKGVITDGDANHPALFAGTMTNMGLSGSNYGMDR